MVNQTSINKKSYTIIYIVLGIIIFISIGISCYFLFIKYTCSENNCPKDTKKCVNNVCTDPLNTLPECNYNNTAIHNWKQLPNDDKKCIRLKTDKPPPCCTAPSNYEGIETCLADFTDSMWNDQDTLNRWINKCAVPS
jgi:hypothetical protein